MTRKKNKDCLSVLSTFFTNLLKIDNVNIPISKAYWQGKWIVFKLQNIVDRGVIYQHVKHLKNAKPEIGKKFQVEDHLPEELKER